MSSQTVKTGFAALGVTVTYNSIGLGPTAGGATLNFERDLVELTSDDRGKTPIDYLTHGFKRVDVNVRLARWSLDNLQVAFPEFALVQGGGNKKLQILSDVGTSMQGKTALLVLHPIALPVTDKTFDVTFPRAFVFSPPEIAFKSDQAPLELVFRALPDDNGLLCTIGDPAVS